MAGPGVGDAHQVKGGLHPAVFPAGAVEAQKHHIRQPARLQHTGAELAFAASGPGGLHRRQVRGLPPYFRQLRRDGGGEHGAGVALRAQVHINQRGLVPPFPQGGAHLAPAGQGDVALIAEPPGQNNYFHKAFLHSKAILYLFYA